MFSSIYYLFVHHLGRHFPLGWLSGSRSLSSQRRGGGGGGGWGAPSLFSFMSDLLVH